MKFITTFFKITLALICLLSTSCKKLEVSKKNHDLNDQKQEDNKNSISSPKINLITSRVPNTGGSRLYINVEGEGLGGLNWNAVLKNGESIITLVTSELSEHFAKLEIPETAELIQGAYSLVISNAYGSDERTISTLKGDTGPQGLQGVPGTNAQIEDLNIDNFALLPYSKITGDAYYYASIVGASFNTLPFLKRNSENVPILTLHFPIQTRIVKSCNYSGTNSTIGLPQNCDDSHFSIRIHYSRIGNFSQSKFTLRYQFLSHTQQALISNCTATPNLTNGAIILNPGSSYIHINCSNISVKNIGTIKIMITRPSDNSDTEPDDLGIKEIEIPRMWTNPK